jgi:hypothetical protein
MSPWRCLSAFASFTYWHADLFELHGFRYVRQLNLNMLGEADVNEFGRERIRLAVDRSVWLRMGVALLPLVADACRSCVGSSIN